MSIWLWLGPVLGIVFFIVAASLAYAQDDSYYGGWHAFGTTLMTFAGLSAAMALVMGIAVACVASDHANCQQTGRTAGVPYKYHINSGCYLQIDDRWIPQSAWVENSGH